MRTKGQKKKSNQIEITIVVEFGSREYIYALRPNLVLKMIGENYDQPSDKINDTDLAAVMPITPH